MFTLYHSRAAISFVAHVALEEAGLPFDLREVSISRGEQDTPDYRAIHPLGRVPALRLSSGEVLTEVAAILGFIAEQAPDRELLPVEPWLRAKAAEWMSLFASTVHPAFIGYFRPQRFVDAEEAQAALRADSRRHFLELLQHVERRLPKGDFVLGDRYSLCDPYAAVFYMWARHFEFPLETLTRYGELFDRVCARPAVRRAFAREGLAPLAS